MRGRRVHSKYKLDKTPVINFNISGTIFRSDMPVQTFTIDSQASVIGEPSDVVKITNLTAHQPIISVKSISINYETGELDLHWTKAPGKNKVVISYEYEMKPVKKEVPIIDLKEEKTTLKKALGKKSVFNASKFIDNQIVKDYSYPTTKVTEYLLPDKNVMPGTVTGTVYVKTEAIQTFCVTEKGDFRFTDIGGFFKSNAPKPETGSIDYKLGGFKLNWTGIPEDNHVVLSYEYEYFDPKVIEIERITKELKSKMDENKTYVKPTFEKFFNTNEISAISSNVGTVCVWDFNTALGDTIKEKYESLYVKVVELTNVLIKKGAKGYFWIVGSPEVTSIFETATAGFWPAHYSEEILDGQIPLGINHEVRYCGIVNSKWRLYKSSEMEASQMIIGCNDKIEHFSHYGRLTISNFII